MYGEMIASIKRGNHRGIFSNAKPLYLLSIIEYIGEMSELHRGITNELSLKNVYIKRFYDSNILRSDNNIKASPILPYFHLNSEPFYELVWKGTTRPKSNAHTPSEKYLRENLAYAKLDDELWDLLQDEGNREYLKDLIIKTYLS